MMNKPHGLLLVLILMLAPAHHALGQAGWRQSLPALEDSDIEQIKKVARQEMSGKPVGTTLGWNNDRTGNHGTVQLQDLFQRDQRECRTLEHLINIKAQGRWRNTVTLCQTPDGRDWRWAQPRSR